MPYDMAFEQQMAFDKKKEFLRHVKTHEFFPCLLNLAVPDNHPQKCLSILVVEVVTLDSSHWTGFNDGHGYWDCSFHNLSFAGKAVYQQLLADNPNCDVYLWTWLDT